MPTHVDLRHREIQDLMPGIEKFQELAEAYGIPDIFQDAGGKMLQLLVAVGLDHSPGRMGADAKDRLGNEYEIKTIDISTGNTYGFSTNHHIKVDTIRKYRERTWVFAIYDRITLLEVYLVKAEDLEDYFGDWETRLKLGRSHINNPKIAIGHVRRVGEPAYIKDKPASWMVDLVDKDSDSVEK